ncbi:MAG: Na+/H+ antiporter [Pseudomonadota bacterium]|nr:Na+/H+ antiporter [Pseudomonadota bacterium]
MSGSGRVAARVLSTIRILVLFLAILAVVAVTARRLKIPPAILLVVVGVSLSLAPGMPKIELAPELVLLLILPPVIYVAGVSMSWREFCFNLRPISLLAVGCVAFTTVAVAAAAHWLIGLDWNVAFLLGAIVSPPDVMAPLAIMRRLKVPRRLALVLEGEGLVNDATALTFYRFAVAAISTGTFSPASAAGTFAVIVAGEVLYGIAVGWLILRLRHWVRDARVEITLALLTPYLAFWVPEHFGGSGVLATVAAGLYVSWNGPRLISAATRLQGIFFWDLIIYLVEGMVFLLTGSQAVFLLRNIGDVPADTLLVYAAVTSAVVIAARFVWVFPATYLPRWLIPALGRGDPAPPWRVIFALGYTGVRGVVSLAAALAIPLAVAGGEAFPDRDLVIFLTFSVILVTLVGQGLSLPIVMAWLKLPELAREERSKEMTAEARARQKALAAVARRTDEIGAERTLPREVVDALQAGLADRLVQLEHRTHAEEDRRRLAELRQEIELSLLAYERDQIHALERSGELIDETRRRIERELDLMEVRLRGSAAEK